MDNVEIEERNRKGVVSPRKLSLYWGVRVAWICVCLHVCVDVCMCVREREKGKEVLHSKQSFCSLMLCLNFSIRIFELPTIY